jgi:hypothetical protein
MGMKGDENIDKNIPNHQLLEKMLMQFENQMKPNESNLA